MKKIVILIILVIIIGGVYMYTNKDDSKLVNNTNVANMNVAEEIDSSSKEIENKVESKSNTENKIEKKAKDVEVKNEVESKKEKTEKNTEKEEKSFDIKGVWQYPDSIYPNEEVIIKSVNDNKITFDYVIDGITSFDNVTADLNNDIATFDVKNDGDWNIKGTMTFKNNTLEFNIKESSNENIQTSTTTFSVKSNKSVLQGISY